MKALVKRHPEKGLWLEDLEKPKPGPNDVLIKIKRTAICGTDVHIYSWDEWSQRTIPIPMQVGHEFSGVIESIGSEVSGLKVGDRVSGEGHIVCSYCRNCRAGARHLCINTKGIGVNIPGAFAEYLVMPAFNVFQIPDAVSYEEAAIFDPFGNAVHTALSFDLVGEDILITGAGPIGIMAAAVSRHVGARKIVLTDINEYRLDLARKMGFEYCINVTKKDVVKLMKEIGMTEGFDVGMEMSGNQRAFNDMLSAMRAGGKISLLGILPNGAGIDWDKVIFKGLIIKGIYGREMFETWYKMSTLLQSGLDIKPVITHNFPVSEFEEAFELMASGKSGKIILDWDKV